MQNTVADNNKEFLIESSRSQELKEEDKFAQELKRLLVKYSALDKEDIHREIETLERWMESYRRDPSVANKTSAIQTAKLENLRDHLKLAAEERQRLESEGGNPASKEQAERVEELLKATRHIEKLLADIKQPAQYTDEKREDEYA